MENNTSGQRATPNTHRNNPSPYDKPRRWNEEKTSFIENQQKNLSPKESGAEKQHLSQKVVKSFRDLAIWQKGISLVKMIYQKTSAFPREEIYGLVAQMRRAAVSIPSNIAEGYRRRHAKEFQQFLNIALGSLGELETQIIVSSELNYFANENKSFLLEEVDHLTRMVISLNKKVDR